MSITTWIRGLFKSESPHIATTEAAATTPLLVEAPIYKDGECGSQFVRWIIAQWVSKGADAVGAYKDDLNDLIAFTEYKAGDELLPRPIPLEFTQWSPGELKLAKAYLESVPPDAFDLDDWLLVVDYLYQRYSPLEVMRADAQMLAARSSFMGKVAASHATMSAEKAAGIVRATPATVKQIIRVNPDMKTPLSKNDFRSVIIPILKGYNNSLEDYSETDISMLYDYGNSVYAVHSVAKDYFIGKNIGEAIGVSSALLRESYETLSAAAALGRHVKIIVPHSDKCCLSLFDQCHEKASDLLSAYSDTAGKFPIFPPYETPCFKNECCYGACPIRFIVLWEGAETGPQIPQNWRELLATKWESMMREQMEDHINWLKESIPDQIQCLIDEETFINIPPTADELSIRPIVELRALQKKCGLKGLRSKKDIAEQLTDPPINDKIYEIVRQWREDRIEQLKVSIKDDKEELDDLAERLVTGNLITL